MKPYKIAFVLDDSLDTPDGVQQYILTLGEWFRSQGHDVHYIVGETQRRDIPNIHSLGHNIRVRFNHNHMSIPWPVSKSRIRQLLARQEFDIIHVQMPYSPMLGGRVIKAAGPQTGVVATFHIAPHSKVVHAANWLLRLIVGRSLKRIDEIVSVSKVAQDFAWRTFSVESSMIPNTLQLERFYGSRPLSQYQKSINIVFFGRLVERKGCEHLLRAVRRLHESKQLPPTCRVLICGRGPLEESLKTYVKTHRLSELVEFTGFVSETNKPHYLAAADVVAYPSTGGESFGIVLLEGMAAARGVVLAGNNPGYANVMGQRPEVLFDPSDEEQLAAKIAKYLQDPRARQEARAWQQQFVRQFDVPNVADEITVIYDEALHKRRS